MKLAELVGDHEATIRGDGATKISGIAYDSRVVASGDLFFCISGLARDGHGFLGQAVANGAAAAVVEHWVDSEVAQVRVPCARAAMAWCASAFYGHPTSKLMLVGVTGTNGKTTTTFLVDSILRCAGLKTGLVGTVEYRIGDEVLPVTRTTPEAADLQRLFREMLDAGVQVVAMEVSSHAIDLHRVDECDFDVLVFTNLTQDHLDYHRTIEEYAAAKKSIFERGTGSAHVINIDDELGREIERDCGAHLTYAVEREADVRARNVQFDHAGATFDLESSTLNLRVSSPLRGAFNVYNSLAAAGVGLVLDLEPGAIATGLESVAQVPGRFESINAGQDFAVLVDYAHTPDSLAQAVEAARSISVRNVIVVFGCGGDRDPGKRPLMGEAAARGADLTVVTSDNPRSERPESIISQIEEGAKRVAGAEYKLIVDRREAIGYALTRAGDGDVVLIAGKGHETGQTFAAGTVPFDDRIVAREELGKLCCR